MARPKTLRRPKEVSAAALLYGLLGAFVLALAVKSLLDGGTVPSILLLVVVGLFQVSIACSLWYLDLVGCNAALVLQSIVGLRAAGRLLTVPLPLNGFQVGVVLFSLAVVVCLSTPRARKAFRRGGFAP